MKTKFQSTSSLVLAILFTPAMALSFDSFEQSVPCLEGECVQPPPLSETSCPIEVAEQNRPLCANNETSVCVFNSFASPGLTFFEASLSLDLSGQPEVTPSEFELLLAETGATYPTSCFVCGCNGDPEEPPVEEQCLYYSGTALNQHKSAEFYYNWKRMITSSDGDQTANEVENLACVQSWIQEVGAQFGATYVNVDGVQRVAQVRSKSNYFDTYLMVKFRELARASGNLNASNDYLYGQYNFVMDRNCNPVVGPIDYSKLCGDFMVSAIQSPISLLWEPNTDIERDVTIVSFPLDPTSADSVYEWKASGQAPLLVFDPEHTGRITSAGQLFGNWTFTNRNQVAGLGAQEFDRSKPWSDGYEALATLDANGDGRINDNELAPLGLWFDVNRDGISQPAEVRSLADAKVTALFYRGGIQDSKTKSISLAIGFERIGPDGSIIRGGSVDWFGEQARNPLELIHKQNVREQLAAGIGTQSKPTLSESPRKASQSSEPSAAATQDVSDQIRGVWRWSVAEMGGKQQSRASNSGYLIFSRDHFGEVIGASVLESLARNGQVTKTVVSYQSLRAIQARTSGKSTSLKFEIVDARSGMKTASSAVLDGDELQGKSELHRPGGHKLTYTWKAVRISP